MNSAAACLRNWGGAWHWQKWSRVTLLQPKPLLTMPSWEEDALSGSSPAVSPAVPTLLCLATGKLFACCWNSSVRLLPSREGPYAILSLCPTTPEVLLPGPSWERVVPSISGLSLLQWGLRSSGLISSSYLLFFPVPFGIVC